MKRFLALTAAAPLLLASCARDNTSPTQPQLTRTGPGYASENSEKIPGEYIVRLRDNVANVPAAAGTIAAAYGGGLKYVYTRAIKGFAIRLPDAAAAALARHPDVLYVEQNQTVHAIAEQTGATWGIDRIDQRDRPVNGTYVYNADGSGVNAYIIDTGIRLSHTEFEGRAVTGYDAVDNDSNADVTQTCNPADSQQDVAGHGTHVAGTVGGKTYGVAKKARLVAVRVLGCTGSGSNAGVIAGINWVADDHVAGQPAVANMSLGGGFSQAVNDAVHNAVVNDGVVFAVAAGNGRFGWGYNPCIGSTISVDSPASELSAITVGATDINDVEAAWSNRGPCLDIFAPGVSVTSAWWTSDNATASASGTSMATPHVTGAAALYLQAHPNASAAEVDQALTDNASVNKISLTNPVGWKTAAPGNWLLYTPFIIAGPPPSPPMAPSGLVASAASSSRIDLGWTDNSDDESGFKIERCTGSGCTNFAQIASAGANATGYSDTGLSASTTYAYRIHAYNSGGDSGNSDAAEATTQAPPPAPQAPINLAATAVSSSEVDLGWTAGSSDEDGFKVERCAGSGCTDFAQIAQVGAGVTTYNNTGVSSSTTYRYRVYAFNAGGISDYSNVADATTPAPPNQAPNARYTWTCKSTSCSFNGTTSSDPDGSIASYAWNFGDGSSATVSAPSHTYATRGAKSVTLTVTDNRDAPGSRMCNINVSNGKTSGTCQ